MNAPTTPWDGNQAAPGPAGVFEAGTVANRKPAAWVAMRNGEPHAATVDRRTASAWRFNGQDVREVFL